MTTAIDTIWTQAIRRYIYWMLLLLFVFALIVVAYYGWTQRTSDRVRGYANSYHLVSSSHYLQATQKLLRMQRDLGQEAVDNSVATGIPVERPARNVGQDYAVNSYQVLKDIQSGLELEDSFDDSRFLVLRARLAVQILKYKEVDEEYIQKGITPDQVGADLKRLLITLNQLIRLHSVARNDLLAELKLLKKRHNLIFYALLSVLFVVGFLLTRRSLAAINGIVAEQQAAEEKISHQAYFDSLTNLPNRLLSLDRLTHQLKKAHRDKNKVAVLFLDLDDFKKVNDSLGHDVGDKLLIEAAGRIARVVRSGDTVGRLGGDEFIVIIGGITDVSDVQFVADKLIEQIKDVFKIEGREIMLSASIGISIYPEDGGDESTLLRNADSAMYHSKSAGRNTYSYFTDAMNQGVARRLALEEQIHGALDRGEFTVFYQQKVDLGNDRITGAEALLRWHNASLGNVSPAEFIPIAEQNGLIIPIGRLVLSEALRMTALWQRDQNPEFRIAVNISPRQFRDPQLVSFIEQSIRQSGVASSHLELEITEGVLMSGHTSIDQALAELSELGVNIAMDDFGTGYSSISYLRRYPFDVVKIDRSFIGDIEADARTRELINASISMAHALNLEVVAEGVETDEQLAFLRQLGCDCAQGYFFGKPIPAEEMTVVMTSHRMSQAVADARSGA